MKSIVSHSKKTTSSSVGNHFKTTSQRHLNLNRLLAKHLTCKDDLYPIQKD